MADDIVVQLLDSLSVKVAKLTERVDSLEGKLNRLSGKKDAKGRDAIQAYRPEVVSLVKHLHALWPKERADGGPIRNNLVDAAARVEHLLDNNSVDIKDLEESCLSYLDSKPGYANAIQFYFGPGRTGETPRWKIELQALLTRRAANG